MLPGLQPDTFAGLTVVDFTRLLPGPFCTMLFAELGARVIKIEPVEGGDYARWYPPLVDASDNGYGAFFASVNRGKESVAIDLRRPEGRDFAIRLVRRADVVVEGFRPGVLDRLGISDNDIRNANPQAIVCRITGFGQDGPLAHRAGHDLGYLARTGALGIAGPVGQPPSVLPLQVADLAGGALYAAFAITAALVRRARTFQGADLDIAMTEGVLTMLAPAISTMLADGKGPRRGAEMLTGGLPCYRTYATADGRHLAVAALEPKFWGAFCAAAGLEHLATEGLSEGAAGEEIARQVAARLAERTRDEWTAIFGAIDCCVEPVLGLDELARDAHFVARRAFDADGLPRLPGMTDGAVAPPVPRLGAHTRALAEEVGYTPAEWDMLLAQGAVVADNGA
jgi:crotonobetainyl-CoA:carnitine CoA-transferase CaiB-like acyl-CoA transferase